MATMFKSSGILRYYKDPLKLVLMVDPEICRYYRYSAPLALYIQKQKYPAHISVVRKATPPNMQFWGKYEGRKVSFEYEHYVHNNDTYWWLNVYSLELERIREELGLKPFGDVTLSPDFKHRFHITIGNTKPK